MLLFLMSRIKGAVFVSYLYIYNILVINQNLKHYYRILIKIKQNKFQI